jgi:hypothetical protein
MVHDLERRVAQQDLKCSKCKQLRGTTVGLFGAKHAADLGLLCFDTSCLFPLIPLHALTMAKHPFTF